MPGWKRTTPPGSRTSQAKRARTVTYKRVAFAPGSRWSRAALYRNPPGFGRTVNAGNILPDSVFVKLRCFDNFIDPVGLASHYTYWPYRVNGPWDPYAGVGGGSCSGFAEWAAMYQYYTCYGCAVRLQYWAMPSASLEHPTAAYITSIPAAAVGAVPDLDLITENSKFSSYKLLAPQMFLNSTGANTAMPSVVVKRYLSVKRIEGIYDPAQNQSSTGGLPASNTTFIVGQFLLGGQTGGGPGSTYQYRFMALSMTYYVKFFGKKMVHEA